MIVTLDANAMVTWVSAGHADVDLARLEHLFETVAKAKGRLILPTPALAELFVRTDDGAVNAWLTILQRKQSVRIAPFDVKAAAECAAIHRRAVADGSKRKHVKHAEAYQKIKVDRQIAAIAIVERSTLLITDDDNLQAVAKANSLRVSTVAELPVPSDALQMELDEGVPSEPPLPSAPAKPPVPMAAADQASPSTGS